VSDQYLRELGWRFRSFQSGLYVRKDPFRGTGSSPATDQAKVEHERVVGVILLRLGFKVVPDNFLGAGSAPVTHEVKEEHERAVHPCEGRVQAGPRHFLGAGSTPLTHQATKENARAGHP